MSVPITLEAITGCCTRFNHWLPQLAQLTHTIMSEPPYNMVAWPIGDPETDDRSTGSIRGMWRYLQRAVESNGGSLVVAHTGETLVAYGQCIKLDLERIGYFSLDHANLAFPAKPGDWLLTYAGLAPSVRSMKYRADCHDLVTQDQYPQGKSLYRTILHQRLALATSARFWIRAHPQKPLVHGIAESEGFRRIGEFNIEIAGATHPRVVFVRDVAG